MVLQRLVSLVFQQFLPLFLGKIGTILNSFDKLFIDRQFPNGSPEDIMVVLVVKGKQQGIEKLFLLDGLFKFIESLHLWMFLFSFIDNFDDGGFIRVVVEGIEGKLLLLGEGYVSFEADTVECKIANDVELLHDLFAEFEDGVVAGKAYYFLLGLVQD